MSLAIFLWLLGFFGLAAGPLSASGPGVVGWGDDSYGQAKTPPDVSNVEAVAAGYYHSLALKNDGTVVAWGLNDGGQTDVPEGLAGVKAIAAGAYHNLVLKNDGTVVAWGYNNYGETDIPDGLADVVAVAAGTNYSLALKIDGTVVAWGSNSDGQTDVPEGLAGVEAIAAGQFHSLALKSDGTVVAWGSNSYGQTDVPEGLAGVEAISAGQFHSLALKSDGTVVAWGSGSVPDGLADVVAVAAGKHSLALKGDGTVVAWGYNASGETDIPDGLADVVAVAAGDRYSLALKSDGTVVAWGRNAEGQANIRSGVDGVMAVAAGDHYSLALQSDGTVVAWGSNGYGETDVPDGLDGVVAIAAGSSHHSLALKGDGTVVAWGDNSYGQSTVPNGLDGVVAISVGYYYSLALKGDGTVVAWGYNASGETDIPDGLENVVAISAGTYHSLALKSDGTVVAWGSNASGETDIPDGLADVVAVAAGTNYSLALKSDGTVVAWGDSYGQAPVPDGLADVVAISARGLAYLALKSDGTVVGWSLSGNSYVDVPPGLEGLVAISAGETHALALVAPWQIDPSNPITLNAAPETGTLSQAWEVDEWTFSALSGARLAVAASTSGGAVPDPSLGRAQIVLLDAAGAIVATAQSAGPGQTAVIQDVVVPADGDYRVQVRVPFAQAGATGHYRVSVWDTSSPQPLVLNQQHLGQIASPGGVEHWTFTAGAGRQLRLDLVNTSDPDLAFTLRGPGGWTGFEESADGSIATLPAEGPYTLTAISTGAASDLAYAFRLVETEPVELTVNTPYAGQFGGDGEAQLFRLEIPSGGPLELVLQNGGAGNRAEIYASRNVPPSRTSYECAAASGPGASRSLSIPRAVAGTVWYVLVYADRVPAPGGYTLEARLSGISLTEIPTASQAGNVPVHLTLRGAGFRAGTVVELVASDETTVYAAATVEVDAYDRLTASFPANAAPPGVYSVRATLPGGGGSATLPGAFTFLSAGTPNLETKLIMPAALGRHGVATIYLEYANTGNAPMSAPVLIVESGDLDGSDRPILTLNEERVIQNYWSGTQGLPPGTANEVLILASGAQPGLLQPGERRTVPIYYSGLLQPWDFSDTAVELEIRYWTEDEAQPIDWAERKESLRPPTLEPAVWDVVYTNLTDGLATTADYVAMLNDNARYLGRLGLRVTDVGDLWHFEVQQAYGHSILPVLDSAADLAVSAPGLPLDLTRTFSSNLRSRNVSGPFGQGWHTPWQARLVVERGGDLIKLVGDAGAATVYTRDTRNGAYFSGAGDSGQLIAAGGGYRLSQPGGSYTRYSADGLPDYVEDVNGNRITAAWNGEGQLTTLTHSSGASITLNYVGGLISQATASTGQSVTYAYNGSYLLSATSDDGKVTSYTYDTSGPATTLHALTSVTRGGVTRHFAWDARGRLASTHLAEGEETVSFSYGSAGSVAVNQAGATTTLFFEHRGLLAKTLDPLGYVTTSEFNADLRLKRLVLPTGEDRRYTWCTCGSPTSITDELGRTTRFKYGHPMKKLTQFTDANDNVTKYTYDANGNLLSTIYADSTVEQLTNYTSSGLAQTWTNRRGQVVSSTWTSSGQPDRETFPDGSYHDFDYDSRNNLIQVTEHPASGPDKVTSYSYTPATDGDRLKQVNYPDGRWVAYSYDALGRRSQMTDSAGETHYEYDAAGRLQRLSDDADETLAEYHYDAAGRLLRIDQGSGAWSDYTYDEAGRILSLTNHDPGGATRSHFANTYDVRGRRTSMTTLDGAWSYTYDATGQLLHAVFDSTNQDIEDQDLRYIYDAVGNRTSTEINGVVTSYVPDLMNRYTSVGGTAHTYDADGNLLDDGERTYQYDILNRLMQTTGPEGTTQYEYDAFGSRTATVLDGVRTEHLLDPTGVGDVLADFRSGDLVARNIHGLGLAARFLEGGDRLYFDIDPLGSVVATRDQAGTVLATQAYRPFGETLATGGAAVDNPFRFVGFFGVTSEANGLGYMQARFYSPGSGKFASDDPVGLQGGDANLSRYVANNPVTFLDSMGTSLFGFGDGLKDRSDAYQDIINGDGPTEENLENLGAAGEQIGNCAEGAGEDLKGMVGKKGGISIFRAVKNIFKIGAGGGLWGKNKGKKGKKRGAGGGSGSCDLPSDPGSGSGAGSSPPSSDSPPTPGGGRSGGRGGSGSAGSMDPNEKIGPGNGSQGWVPADSLLPYRINFENIGPGSKDANGNPYPVQATAPAQRVTITDELEADLDWSTFQITDFGWGDTVVSVPDGPSHHTETVRMTYGGKTFDVEVEAGIDYAKGQVFVRFQSLDPDNNGLPPDVLTGFLPPEDGNGVGKGYFAYTIRTKANLPTGTAIRNVAVIKFDNNESIATNQIDPQDASKGFSPDKEALVTLDREVPSATVTALPASTGSANFTVRWSGTDDGSGIVGYDIYVSVDGGPWQLWLAETSATSGTYAGAYGRSYSFHAVARDLAGNAQVMGNVAQATTTLKAPDLIRPTIRITGPKPTGRYAASGSVLIRGTASDNTALARWQYKLNSDKWKTGGALSGKSRAWKKTVRKAKVGRNRVQVRAYDAAGLVSKVAIRNFLLKK